MKTLAELERLVRTAIGGRGDVESSAVIRACINYAAIMAAVIFKPPELHRETLVNVSSGTNQIVLDSVLTRWFDIVSVYNVTDSTPMGFIPYEMWRLVIPDVDKVRLFTVFGSVMYIHSTPTQLKQLSIGYNSYPAELVNDNDLLEFSNYDPYIISTASGLAWAFFEEAESSALWSGVQSIVTNTMSVGSRAKEIISGLQTGLEVLRDVYITQGTQKKSGS